MARKSRDQDRLLIEKGIELFPEMGSRGMSLRRVADEAKVNVGMFHYHFKTKDEFLKAVLGGIFEKLKVHLDFENVPADSPKEALRELLFRVGKFARAHREIMIMLVADYINGEKVVREFLASVAPMMISQVGKVISEAQRRGEIAQGSFFTWLPMFIGVVHMPTLITAAIERSHGKNSKLATQFESELLTDEAIRKRVDTILKGVSPGVSS